MTTLNTAHHRGTYIQRAKTADLDSNLALLVGNTVGFNALSEFLDYKNLSSPVHGNTVGTAVTLAMGESGSKRAQHSTAQHSTARAERTVRPRGAVGEGVWQCRLHFLRGHWTLVT